MPYRNKLHDRTTCSKSFSMIISVKFALTLKKFNNFIITYKMRTSILINSAFKHHILF